MGGPRSKATPEETLAAFHTDEPFKAVAKRLRMSPNTLRTRWKTAFGEDAFKSRGKKLQARAAAKTARAMSKNRVYKDVSVTCTGCGSPVVLKTNQVAQMDLGVYLCPQCRGDRDCSVCGLRVDGERGLSQHFRHRRDAQDAAHMEYEQELEDARWAGKEEGLDYLVCRECGLRLESLTGHILVHGLTAPEYRTRHGADALLRPWKVLDSMRVGMLASPAHQKGRDVGTKPIECDDCGVSFLVSKSFTPSIHDARCDVCKATGNLLEEELRWEGLEEPEDYVRCRQCGYRGANLTSHLQSKHPELVGQYMAVYPGALINAQQSGSRIGGSSRALGLTKTDLLPYADKKGRVVVAQASEAIGCSWWTVLRYCRLLGIPTRNRLAFQKRVLDAFQAVLDEPYVWEWAHPDIVNPKTGYRLFFDGYFPGHNLVVEANGKQHYQYVEWWHKTREQFEYRQKLDVLKARRLREEGVRLVVVRYDEPFNDPMYLRGRLVGAGLVSPGKPGEGLSTLEMFSGAF